MITEERLKEAKRNIARLVRARELKLDIAKSTGKLLEDIFTEVAGKDLHRQQYLKSFKDNIVKDITELAEKEYLATVQAEALRIMERDRTLTAAEAVAEIESIHLEAVLGM